MGDVNLIPAGRLTRRRRRRRLCVWATACGLYVVLVGAGSLTFHVARAGETRSAGAQLEALDRQIEQNNRALLDVRGQLAGTSTAWETARALRGQPDWSKLLTGLAAQLGDEIVLCRCQLATTTVEGRALGAEEGGTETATPLGTFLTGCRRTLVLNGYGKSQAGVSQFVLRLERCGVFDLVRLVSSSRQTFLDGEAVAFTVECRL